jgi:hypothetical protein
MERETYNSRLKKFAVLVERPHGTYISHDVLFPSGRRTIFVPMNWEVVSYANPG